MQKQEKPNKLEKAWEDGHKAGLDAKDNDQVYPYAFGRLVGYIEMNHRGEEILWFLRGMDEAMGMKK